MDKASPGEEKLLNLAEKVCGFSPKNILLIGGGMISPSIVGFKKFRPHSNDLDFVVNDKGFDALFNSVNLKVKESKDWKCFYSYDDDVLLAFFHSDIRGYEIPGQVYENPFIAPGREIFSVPPEMNIALKVRRGATRNHIYGKDAQDFASTILGLSGNGGFDYGLWKECMVHGVCSSCRLPRGEFCIDALEKGFKHVRKRYMADFLESVKHCRDLAEDFCENY